jgi:hypothetical protein
MSDDAVKRAKGHPDMTPHETQAEVVARTEKGPYIVAPDSADPWPDAMWNRLDLEALDAEITRLQEHQGARSAADRHVHTEPSGVYFSVTDRELLLEIGGHALASSLTFLRPAS